MSEHFGYGKSEQIKNQDFKLNRMHPRDPESKLFRTILFVSLGTIAVALLAAVLTFILTLEGEEETMIPDVQGMELANAIIELQDKGLYATVQLRYSERLSDKGTVIGQDPKAGSVVKARSEVLLWVSKGAAVEKLDNYVGWNIVELESHLKSLESVLGPILTLQKPYIRVFDDSPPGTILEQKPAPGTELTVLTELQLVVSKGPEGQVTVVGDYTGMDWRTALNSVAASGVPFIFTVTRGEEGEGDPGTIVYQTPEPGSEVPTDTLRQLLLRAPVDLEKDYQFGIIERDLPAYPVPVPIEVERITSMGEVELVLAFEHSGGLLTVPYVEENGTTLVVRVDNEDIVRLRVVKQPLE
jgi:beta-lactam-binding protein with PASTA domain